MRGDDTVVTAIGGVSTLARFVQELLPWSPIIGIVIAGTIAGWFAVVNRRGGEKAQTRPSWSDLEASNRAYRAELVNLPTQLRAMEDSYRDALADVQEDLKKEFDRRIRNTEATFNRKLGATSRILRSIAEQAPIGFLPILDPDDLAEIDEDTIPAHWRPALPARKEKA